MDSPKTERTVHCEDALSWLERTPVLTGSSLVASMPDISEFPKFTLQQWKDWFTSAAELILSRAPDSGVVVFYQSDIKVDGVWVDKGHLCQVAAEHTGHSLLWHKIVCRVKPGQSTFGRPAYSHMVCFSKDARADPAKATPDVIPDIGDKTWERGMGLEACVMIARFIKEQTASHTIVNPFCGQGSMLAVANAVGLSAVGIERSPKRAECARALEVDLRERRWITSANTQ